MWPPASDDDFAAFYRVEAELLVRFLLGLGACVPDALDATGRAFAEVLAQWPQLTDPRSYLRRIAVNELAARPDGDAPPFRECWAAELIEQACQQDGTRQLLAALRTLPRQQREVLAWHRDGYSTSDIAELLGLSIGAVQASLRAATETLRQLGMSEIDWL